MVQTVGLKSFLRRRRLCVPFLQETEHNQLNPMNPVNPVENTYLTTLLKTYTKNNERNGSC